MWFARIGCTARDHRLNKMTYEENKYRIPQNPRDSILGSLDNYEPIDKHIWPPKIILSRLKKRAARRYYKPSSDVGTHFPYVIARGIDFRRHAVSPRHAILYYGTTKCLHVFFILPPIPGFV